MARENVKMVITASGPLVKEDYSGVMADIETLSVHESRALIISVAALRFDMLKAGPEFGARHVWRLDLLPQLMAGRVVDPKTVEWWRGGNLDQPRDAILKLPITPLHQFFMELKAMRGESDIWANGAHFDLTNLKQLALDVGFGEPWIYRAPRDARTMYEHVPRYRTCEGHVEHLVAHDALDDCVKQVWRLWEHWSWEDSLSS